jgi:hypothetical protein
MDYQNLKTELVSDPLARGYSGMSNAQAATSLNTVNRSVHKTSMSGSEVLQSVVPSEYNALTAEKKDQFWGLVGIGVLDPWGKEADVMIDIFGAGSATITALAVARIQLVSRAVELGFGRVETGDVQCARAL